MQHHTTAGCNDMAPTPRSGSSVAGIGIALMAGLLFGAGLILAGMTDPQAVLAFLDVAGAWNPKLAFVMGGAVASTLIGFRLVMRRSAPWCDARFHMPDKKTVDAPLLAGAALFGVGWGLTGYCPGPALTGLMAGNAEVGLVVGSMLAGAWLQRRTGRR